MLGIFCLFRLSSLSTKVVLLREFNSCPSINHSVLLSARNNKHNSTRIISLPITKSYRFLLLESLHPHLIPSNAKTFILREFCQKSPHVSTFVRLATLSCHTRISEAAIDHAFHISNALQFCFSCCFCRSWRKHEGR